MIKRSLAFLICLVLTVTIIGCKKKPVEETPSSSQEMVSSTESIDTRPVQTVEFKALSAGKARTYNTHIKNTSAGRTNDILLFGNPDRGYRTTLPLPIKDKHPDPEDSTKTTTTCDLFIRNQNGSVSINPNGKCRGKHSVEQFYANLDKESLEKSFDYLMKNVYFRQEKTDYKSKLILVQASIPSWNKTDVLPDDVFKVLDIFFDKCRERECKVLFRYCYHGLQLNWQVSEENREKHEKVNANEETMLKHIEQFAPFLAKNIDVIHKMSSGVIASGGEMAFDYQYPVVDYDKIIKAIVEKICVPNNIYYTCRLPAYKLNLLENDPEYEYASYIGNNNDAFFGEQERYGMCSDCFQYNHDYNTPEKGQCEEHDLGGDHIANNWYEYVCETAAYTPQSGEMYHNIALRWPEKCPTGMEAIKQLAHHRYTTLSQWNSYIESGFEDEKVDGKVVSKDSVMQRWIDNETVTPEMLDAEGIIYDPAWFYDDSGKLVHRNPYEFIRDYLGYKVQAQNMIVKGEFKKDSLMTFDLTLKNYGFAAAFNIESGYMILDENYNVVSEVKAGEPEKWYSHDPEDWKSTEVLEHNVKADLTLPSKSGKYYIAFYMRNTMEDYAKLSNNMSYINDKYNILYEFEI